MRGAPGWLLWGKPPNRETCGHTRATDALQPLTAGMSKATGMCKATHVHTRAPGTGSAHTDVPVCVGLACPDVPAGDGHRATSIALSAHSETRAQMPLLPLPLWCQTLKGKNFYYLKGPPVQCLFFFLSFFFLMHFGNRPVSFTPSTFPRLENKLKKGINQSKRAPARKATPLSKWPCSDEM